METLDPYFDEKELADSHEATEAEVEKVKTDWEPIKPPQAALEREDPELVANAHKYLRDRTLVMTIDVPQGNPVTYRLQIEGADQKYNWVLLSGDRITYRARLDEDKEATEYAIGHVLHLQSSDEMMSLLKGHKLTNLVRAFSPDGRSYTPYVTIELEPLLD